MAHVVKTFDRERGLPFWYVEERDGSNRVGPFSTGAEAHAHLERESRRSAPSEEAE